MKKFIILYVLILIILYFIPQLWLSKYSLELNIAEFTTEWYKALWGLFNILIVFVFFDYLAKKIILKDTKKYRENLIKATVDMFPQIKDDLSQLEQEIKEKIVFVHKNRLKRELNYLKVCYNEVQNRDSDIVKLFESDLEVLLDPILLTNINVIHQYLLNPDKSLPNSYYTERIKQLKTSLTSIDKTDVDKTNITIFVKIKNLFKIIINKLKMKNKTA